MSVDITLAGLESICSSEAADLSACPLLSNFEECQASKDCSSSICGSLNATVSDEPTVCLPTTCIDGITNGEVDSKRPLGCALLDFGVREEKKNKQ